MIQAAVKYLSIGFVIALATTIIAWLMAAVWTVVETRWQIVAVIMLAAELIFLLFVPANKSGQQFGPHGWSGMTPFQGPGSDFYDEHPSRRAGDFWWLLVGIPILVVGVALLVAL